MAKMQLTGSHRAAAEAAIAKHAARRKGALRLALIQSKTRADTMHSIMLGSDNLVYCTCERWTYAPEDQKACPHLDEFKQTLKEKQ